MQLDRAGWDGAEGPGDIVQNSEGEAIWCVFSLILSTLIPSASQVHSRLGFAIQSIHLFAS